MTISPSGQYIAFPYDETTLFIADIKTGKPIKVFAYLLFNIRHVLLLALKSPFPPVFIKKKCFYKV
ncbi:MAG: hypothetical protein ACTSR5_17625, partial [Promethearchaeota archaeon]